MLPLHASSAQQEKMNRHGFGGAGAANGGYDARRYSISTDKYDRYVE
jgi:hypothetical protein